jgi:preprotein translocase subunit SecE
MGRLQRKKTPGAKKKKKQDLTTGAQDAEKNQSEPKSAKVLGGMGKKPGSGNYQKAVTVRRKKEPGRIKGFFDQSLQFLREVKIELKKVAWPSRKQTIGSTVVVVVLVLIISAFLGLVDVGLASIIRVVLQ